MILGVDTDVLVNWAMAGAPHHRACRQLLEREVRSEGSRLGVTPQVLFEFLHVCTDRRRFEQPMAMDEGENLVRDLWDRADVARLLPDPTVVHRAMELLGSAGLGRNRILDTVLAATLEAAGVRRLATLNGRDFAAFPFLEVVGPSDAAPLVRERRSAYRRRR